MHMLVLAQQASEVDQGAGLFGGLCGLIIFLIVVAALWQLFTKAGKPGWAALIPIYNTVVLLEIVGRPLWWIVLLFIPFVNFIVGIMVSNDLAKSFGKGIGYTLGLIFLSPIFLLLLAFGDARYEGPAAA